MEKSSLEDTLRQLPELFKEKEGELAKREKALVEKEKEFQHLKDSIQEEYPSLGEPPHVILLDVGGTPLTLLRKTLTQIKGSTLASKFSGKYDENLAKTPEGRFVIDQSIDLFLPLIDYLRALAMAPQTPSVPPPKPPTFGTPGKWLNFVRLLEFYKMTHGVYPFGVYKIEFASPKYDQRGKLSQQRNFFTFASGFPAYEVDSSEFSTFCLKPVDYRHHLYIKSFEVVLHDVAAAQVGWAESSTILVESTPGVENKGFGYVEGSMAFDVVRSGIVFLPNNYPSSMKFDSVPNVTVHSGSVIRCEERGKRWYIDGKLVASSEAHPNVAHVQNYQEPGEAPCVSLKGRCEFKILEYMFSYPEDS